MSEASPVASSGNRRDKLTEVVAAVLLSLSAFISSWSGYQAGLWDGEQAARYAQAGAARVTASRLATRAGQYEGADMLMFSEWLDAYARSDLHLQQFYRERFRPEFAVAFERWLALHPASNPSAPPTPFDMRDYHSRTVAQSLAAEKQADTLFDSGEKANDVSDAFENGTVYLALSLFLCGIVQTFTSYRIRLVLLGVASLACVAGIARIAFLPALGLR